MDDLDRFWTYAAAPSDEACWEWTGGLDRRGYGMFWSGAQGVRAYRWLYERMVGAVPAGMHLDHLCRNTKCVNWHHLEVVTPRENIMRGEGVAARFAARTHCDQGHPFSGDNLIVSTDRRGYVRRRCRVCAVEAQRRYAARRKGATSEDRTDRPL
jgi:hypothetical protein